MICSEYIRCQNIPACWNASQSISGITVPVNGTAVKIYMQNLSTGLINILDATSGGAGEITIPMDDVAPLYPHTYDISVVSDPDRVAYQLTVNGETGCSIRAKVYDNPDDPADSLVLTTDTCLTS